MKLLACLLLAAATLANAAPSRRSSPPDPAAPFRRSSPPDPAAPSRRSSPPDPAAPSRRSSPPDPAAQKHFHSYALVYGTVFYEESGFLVRGARVEVRLKDSKKRWESKTNDEGSFAIQVPPGKAVYVVEAQIPGRDPDRKEVAVENDERVDVVLHLKGKQ